MLYPLSYGGPWAMRAPASALRNAEQPHQSRVTLAGAQPLLGLITQGLSPLPVDRGGTGTVL